MASHETLQALYPYLHGGIDRGGRLDPALLHATRMKSADSVGTQQLFFQRHGEQVVAAAHAIAAVFEGGGRLFTMGNGGSACDAAHIAVEFSHPVTAGRPALPSINLAADMAMLTAVGNDLGIEHVFVRQLLAQARRGDALIGVSTSGNSTNLLAAFAKARELGLATLGLAGHDGGAMAATAGLDHCLVVESDSIHRIQETQVVIYHVLWDLVHTLLADRRGALAEGPPP
jgi:D-sedoheptulose 7-phosphate isomerase